MLLHTERCFSGGRIVYSCLYIGLAIFFGLEVKKPKSALAALAALAGLIRGDRDNRPTNAKWVALALASTTGAQPGDLSIDGGGTYDTGPTRTHVR